jgi:hypothetical protein
LFGCARTYAMNSATVLGGKSLFTTSTNALTATALMGAKSLIGTSVGARRGPAEARSYRIHWTF